MTDKRGYL